ncbi:SRPBCC family protein [Streptomyces sp. NPDC052701]|uniref:SRPBCC family protein n=1 Tax=Streptomyces sp. NPDC052701 TaxID=3155533 RepID=UPI003426C4A4
MAELTLRAVGRARPDTVWFRYTSCREWPTWSPQIVRVRARTERIAPGTRGTIRSFFGVTAAFLVESVDEERRSWTWRVRWGPLRMRLTHDVLPHGDGTETRLRMQGPALALAAYAPLARVALHRLLTP